VLFSVHTSQHSDAPFFFGRPTTNLHPDRTASLGGARRDGHQAGRFSSATPLWLFEFSSETGGSIGLTRSSAREASLLRQRNTVTAGRTRVICRVPPTSVWPEIPAGAPPAIRREQTFRLGGAAANPSSGWTSGEKRSAAARLRCRHFCGSRVALLNADYRFPLAPRSDGGGPQNALATFLHHRLAAGFPTSATPDLRFKRPRLRRDRWRALVHWSRA